MIKDKEILAHLYLDDENKSQSLIDHLFSVSKIAGRTGKDVGLKNSCELIGLLHDCGKFKDEFQLYIRGKYKGRVDHSTMGGFMIKLIEERVYVDYKINDFLESKGLKKSIWKLYSEILQYPILAHHGLYDIIDNAFNYRTKIRFDSIEGGNNEIRFFNNINSRYIKENNRSIFDLYLAGFEEFIEINDKIKKIELNLSSNTKEKQRLRKKSLAFYKGVLVRLLLSVLKDADIYDSSNYYRENKDKTYSCKELSGIWDESKRHIENQYKTFNENTNKTKLDKTRTNLSDEIYHFSQKYDSGAYKLDLPVGSGKTLASLRYAVGNAQKFGKKRIFYCTAFLSVLEQNASSVREVIGDSYVLEHHSNIIEDNRDMDDTQDLSEYENSEYLKESWESPIILTTFVQLSNTLFKHKSSNIRRFSKLINSVILIDEIQSLPIKAIYNFNLMTNFLTAIMNCTIVHSTATPPNLDNIVALDYPCIYGNNSEQGSIVNMAEEMEVFDRVDYHSLLGEKLGTKLNDEELIDHLRCQLKHNNSALVVLNTKRAVANLYEALINNEEFKKDKVEIVYLTTNQCPMHRLNLIKDMKEKLISLRNNLDDRKIICVSTKLVEAGVDIDFDLAYRSLAGIDSIIQIGGRCNREGKKEDKGKLFIFKYENEDLKYLPEISNQRSAAEAALKVLANEEKLEKGINIKKAIDYYFHKLYLNEKAQANNLEFPIGDDETILNLLTTNAHRVENYRSKTGKKLDFNLRQGFKTAAMEFDLIREESISVIVNFENNELMEELYKSIENEDYYIIKNTLKRLQPYTVNIRRTGEFENYITRELNGEILILSQEAYDDKIGLKVGSLQTLTF
ncbi:MAG: CRISPR-associated helicase Cas3' [Tissierellaceae bacterium]|nr:CRISPR-associated helicase Cas3' [Tissierellaceae bacterium]